MQSNGFQDLDLVLALQERASRIRELEEQAEGCLSKEEFAKYKELLQEKARILQQMPLKLENLMQRELAEEPELLQEAQSSLQGFAQRAAKALELESVFFMRMLLYPEDYVQGQGNDLEGFISWLQNRA
ncbi:MAG: hypothetical protein ACLFRL_00960 [Desulfohalobiaceae bacterium]